MILKKNKLGHGFYSSRFEYYFEKLFGKNNYELNLKRPHAPNYWIIILPSILVIIGLVVVYAIGPALSTSYHIKANYYTNKQLIAVALSMVAFIATYKFPLKKLRQVYKPLLWVAGIATMLALVMPVNPAYPAHRWVRLGSLSFQSVELVKFAVLIWFAGFLSDRMKHREMSDTKRTLYPIAIATVIIGFIIAGVQSDLGSMGVLVCIMLAMAFVAGLPMKPIAMFIGIIIIGLILAISTSAYRRARIATYLHPSANCQTAGYQECQALIAVGSGGMTGLGLGRSVQAYGYLPEAANDSIFAIYAEKFGFIGSLILLGLFFAFFRSLKNIIDRIPDNFSKLIVVGVLTWLSIQSLINIGAMIGILPLKGITLPFISYGGTSMVFTLAAVGLVFQISRYTDNSLIKDKEVEGKHHEDSLSRRRFGRAYHSNPGYRS